MEHLAVIGSGTMGHSIALNAAWSGLEVCMYGVGKEDVDKGLAGIRRKLEVLICHDLADQDSSERILKKIQVTSVLDEALSDATFIIECIPESISLKNSLFLSLDGKCGQEVILASNTSGLSLKEMTGGMAHPERAILTHFWNPAHLIPLVEVLRGEKTTDSVFDRTMALLKVMDKKPVEVKKEVPGLIGNRLQFALFREAQYLFQEGIASREDIDAAVTQSIGRRLSVTGPLMSADMGGLDVFSSISNYLFKNMSNADRSSPALEKLVSGGKLGDKSGEGYYVWSKEFSEKMNGAREHELIRFIKQDKGLID